MPCEWCRPECRDMRLRGGVDLREVGHHSRRRRVGVEEEEEVGGWGWGLELGG